MLNIKNLTFRLLASVLGFAYLTCLIKIAPNEIVIKLALIDSIFWAIISLDFFSIETQSNKFKGSIQLNGKILTLGLIAAFFSSFFVNLFLLCSFFLYFYSSNLLRIYALNSSIKSSSTLISIIWIIKICLLPIIHFNILDLNKFVFLTNLFIVLSTFIFLKFCNFNAEMQVCFDKRMHHKNLWISTFIRLTPSGISAVFLSFLNLYQFNSFLIYFDKLGNLLYSYLYFSNKKIKSNYFSLIFLFLSVIYLLGFSDIFFGFAVLAVYFFAVKINYLMLNSVK
jgi:hypothetical protein